MKKSDKFGIGLLLGLYSIIIILMIGWIINLVRLLGGDWCVCKWTIIRIIGLFVVPLGGILGFIPR